MAPESCAEIRQLERSALQIRRNILRLIKAGKAGHLGGALSMADVLAALYFRVMKVDPARPDWPERDRLVVSAGHKALVLYAALAARGYFPPELLDTYGSLGSRLPGHRTCTSCPGWRPPPGRWATACPSPEAWRWGCVFPA
jgi:transketolase